MWEKTVWVNLWVIDLVEIVAVDELLTIFSCTKPSTFQDYKLSLYWRKWWCFYCKNILYEDRETVIFWLLNRTKDDMFIRWLRIHRKAFNNYNHNCLIRQTFWLWFKQVLFHTIQQMVNTKIIYAGWRNLKAGR